MIQATKTLLQEVGAGFVWRKGACMPKGMAWTLLCLADRTNTRLSVHATEIDEIKVSKSKPSSSAIPLMTRDSVQRSSVV